jgi:hypothetical protein
VVQAHLRHTDEEGPVNVQFAHRIATARRLGALAAIGLCAIAATAGPAAAKPAHAQAGKAIALRYYSEVVGFVYRNADGTVAQQPSQNPAVGDQMEITELGYKGTHKSHAKKWSASSYTICVFKSAKGAPTCDGVSAVGGAQLLLFHTVPDGDPAIVGGTGRYAGATGGVQMTQLGDTNNSDLVITVNLRK